jgi:hypothetical protein
MSVPPSGRLISIRWNGSKKYTVHASIVSRKKRQQFMNDLIFTEMLLKSTLLTIIYDFGKRRMSKCLCANVYGQMLYGQV